MGQIFIPTAETFPNTADAVVIGGGIVGVATAFWLSRAGLDTVLVERRDGLSTLTTPESIESFRAQFTEPAMSELAVAGIEMFEHLADLISMPGYDIGIKHQGYLFVTADADMVDDVRAAVEKHHALGVTDSEFLTGDEARACFPYLSASVVAASFRQRDGWLSSHEATQGFAKGCDARFLVRTEATRVLRDAHGVCGVETDRGVIAARVVVNAAGPFAGQVGRTLGLDLPLEAVRRQKVFLSQQPLVPQDAPLTIDLVRDAYWRPETGGAYIAWVDPDEPVAEHPSENPPTDPYFAAIVLEKLIESTPFWEEVAMNLKKADVHPSAGYYVYTPDDQPLIGPMEDVPGFYLNCGYWAGVMLAPAAGQRVADLVTGALKPEENPLRPSRYEEGIVVEGNSFLRGRH
ncbi:MAG TPA: FAD-binding oxidoreductase [Chloroflexi bacterium]|mgnify:CR=1 FL=1|nr:FAD-binding oxidoreductase [Chloroflexota bacterium]